MEEETATNNYGYLAICSHAFTDLSILDFSVYGLQFISLKNDSAKKFLEPLFGEDNDRSWDWINDPEHDGHKTIHNEHFQLLAPINPYDSPKEDNFFELMHCLRVIAPSHFHIKYMFHYGHSGSGHVSIHSMERPHGPVLIRYDDPYADYLTIPENRYGDINQFVKHFQECIKSATYARHMMNYYLGSFFSNDAEMYFLGILICLEGLAPGSEQVSYTLRRNIAVLCGKDEEAGMLIFSNMKKLYTLRSKMVHCAMQEKDWKDFSQYSDYARTIASQCLLELFGHSFNSIEELTNRLNITGIGERVKLSKSHVPFDTCSKVPLLIRLS